MRGELITATLLCLLSSAAMSDVRRIMADESSAAADDYLRHVKPLLAAKCTACHGGLRQKGNLRLDTAKFLLKGGDSGPAIVVGDSAKSVLIEAILGENGRTKMPIDGEPVTPAQLDLLRRWIDNGAKAPDDEPAADPRDHWAFRKPTRPRIPLPKGEGGRRPSEESATIDTPSRELKSNEARIPHRGPLPKGEGIIQLENPIDAFLSVEHARLGITPLPSADRATLLRRVYLDLIGIPPTRDELLSFLSNDEPDAYARVVNRLLESPLHAQRWAKHWMDIWRYSDWYGSRGGNELRNSRRHIWRWRDWIIDSLAADKGYDRMIVEMLAADEITPGDRDIGRAAGYLGRSYYVFNRHVWLQDTVEYTAASFIGLTFKCARCHDHKYDPIAQDEYYRFRAFFEPHNVRTDQLVGKSELITGQWPAGAPPGNKLKEGDDVIFDADLVVPTYVLARGNEKNPLTDRPMTPGVPSVLGATDLPIAPVSLPLEAYYPDLRPERREELLSTARAAIANAEVDAAKALAAVEIARAKLNSLLVPTGKAAGDERQSPGPTSFLDVDFSSHNKDVWKVLSGDWDFEDRKLKLKAPGHFVTIATLTNHPQDFKATLKYRTLPGGSFGSVGLFFDMVDLKDAQAVYTHVNANSSGVQAFHRKNGAESYPAAGVVAAPLKLNEETTLEIVTRGQELKIWLNGELKLTYTMPTPRQPGRFALWCHQALAEFTSLKIVPNEPSIEDLKLALQKAEADAALAVRQTEVARAEAASLETRIAAELAKSEVAQRSRHAPRNEPNTPTRPNAQNTSNDNGTSNARSAPHAEREDHVEAIVASKAERTASLAKAELESLRAEQELELVKSQISNLKSEISNLKTTEALKAAEGKLTMARAAVETAKTNAAKEDTNYTPIGPTYPTTSTGRRLALARWITSQDNPLTARVAVNHVWKRHFGTALVPSVANFGLNGKPPTHPALLDWLAVEFMESGWSLRHLHRLIVTSAAYRRASSIPSPLPLGEGGRTPGEGREALESHSDQRQSTETRIPHPSPLPGGERTAAFSFIAKLDPENRHYWRANIRRMEAEVVRDTLWSLTNSLDRSFGGQELEPSAADATPRRSLYFRHTPDDQAVMLELFDGPSAAECFERTDSIMPQQALSLANSHLALTQSRLLARELSKEVESRETRVESKTESPAPNSQLSSLTSQLSSDSDFIHSAFERVLSRSPQPDELAKTEAFLQLQSAALADPTKLTRTPTGLNSSVPPSADPRQRARENLVHVLLNYHEFVTIR